MYTNMHTLAQNAQKEGLHLRNFKSKQQQTYSALFCSAGEKTGTGLPHEEKQALVCLIKSMQSKAWTQVFLYFSLLEQRSNY